MHLKILGSRVEIEKSLPYHCKHSGVLVDNNLLFDVGEKEFCNYRPKAIIITHFHPDHAYFVRWGLEENPPINIPIYAPEKINNKKINFDPKILEKEKIIEGYRIIAFPVHHSKLVKSQAYLVRKNKKSFLYTGDLVWIDKQYLEKIDQVDLVITDGSYLRKGGMIRKDPLTQQLYGHNGIPNLIDLFKGHTKKILFVHFGSWFYEDTKSSHQKLNALSKEKGIQILIGYDGLEVIL